MVKNRLKTKIKFFKSLEKQKKKKKDAKEMKRGRNKKKEVKWTDSPSIQNSTWRDCPSV